MHGTTGRQIVLPGSVTLGYAEYGDPLGVPVLHFHGTPSSRLEVNQPDIHEGLAAAGIRLIAIDRPGIGLSGFTRYTLSSWPDMVVAFADAVGIETFSVSGVSSGGKYVAACAWKIPDRLHGAVIISGTCPLDRPGAREALGKRLRLAYALADKAPWLFQAVLWKFARNTRKSQGRMRSVFSDLPDADAALLADPHVADHLRTAIVEAFRSGTRGVSLDWALEARPWGFALEDIRMPVDIWHGEADTLVPVEHGRILEQAIPGSRAEFCSGEGHLSMVANFFVAAVKRATDFNQSASRGCTRSGSPS